MYVSDITRFLEDLKKQRPGLEQRQQQGRALLWDKEIDLDAQQAYRAARVPQKPYVYSSGL